MAVEGSGASGIASVSNLKCSEYLFCVATLGLSKFMSSLMLLALSLLPRVSFFDLAPPSPVDCSEPASDRI